MNKILILIAIFFTFNFQSNAQGVAINTTSAAADASAALDVQSTTQGMLVPRMTAAQRGIIATPATGLLVYQTDGSSGFYLYNGTAWTSLNNNASALTTGTLPDARLSPNVTTQGNTFNGTSQLVQTNASGKLPNISGENLTNLNASNMASGTVPTGRLGSGTADNTTFLRGDNTWVASGGDNLGNHTATQNVNLANNDIVGVDSIGTGKAKIGANSYPTTTGTNGQVLTSNGAGTLSWQNSTSASNGNIQLLATFVGAPIQTLPVASSITQPSVVAFSTSCAECINPSTQGLGNTMIGDTTFMCGTAGYYEVSASLTTGTTSTATGTAYPVPVLEINNIYTDRIFGVGCNGVNAWQAGTAGAKGRGMLYTVLYLAVGNTIKIKGQNGGTASTCVLHQHLSCRWMVRKL